MLASLTLYTTLKALHVLLAVIWVGGGVCLTVLALRAQRAKDPLRLVRIAKDAEWFGTRVFVPASILLVLLGGGMLATTYAKNVDYTWSCAWIIIGIVGFAISFVTGAAYLGPSSGKLAKLMEERGPEDPDVQAAIGRILLVARIDVVILLLVVLDMVLKPGTPTG
jgi:uncharacterized membrane protein